jgi:flagellin
MTVINTNVKALVAQNALKVNSRSLNATMEQLSTGKRVNSARDDAAGLAIASRMTSQIRGLDQAVRNANDGISLLQTAEGALIEVTNMLQRMRELAVQSATDTNSADDRLYLNDEYVQLMGEIDRVAETTEWNGMKVLNSDSNFAGGYVAGTSTDIATSGNIADLHVGAKANQTISVSFKNFAVTSDSGFAVSGAPGTTGFYVSGAQAAGSSVITASGVAVSSASGGIFNGSATIAGSNITTQASSNAAITALDFAIKAVNTERSLYGSTINRLTYTVDNMTNVSNNTSEARSRILDTDYGKATSELARTQIVQQAATAMLAQANQSPQMVLSLLQ